MSRNQHVHFPGLDTLRAMAILIVIPWHAMGIIHNPPMRSIGQYGWMGVDLFFVLSGFLIGSQIFQTLKNSGSVQFSRFYLKRSFRIIPAYWTVLLVYLLWPAFRESDNFGPPWRFFLFIANLPMIGKTFSHAWSLCVEEHFYLLFPAVVWWYSRRRRAIHPGVMFACLVIVGMILRYFLWLHFSENGSQEKWGFFNVIYYPSYCRIDGLAVGVCLAMLREYREGSWIKLTSRPWTTSLVGVALVGAGLMAFGETQQMTASVFAFPLVSFGFGALVVAAMSPGFWLCKFHVPGAALLATASYTIYLTHKQMMRLTVRLIDQPDDHPIFTVCACIAMMALASAILHFGVERPGLVLRDRLLRRKSQ